MGARFTNVAGAAWRRTTNVPTITNFTAMAWVYLGADLNTYSNMLTIGTDVVVDFYQLGSGADGTILNLWNGASHFTGSQAFTIGSWGHIAMTVAGTGNGQYLGYLNGVLDITADGNSSNTAGRFDIGDNDNGGFDGRIAAVKVYSGAVLTADEIKNEMRYYIPRRTANLNTWLPCVHPTAAGNLVDFSGNAFNMTLIGTAPTVEDGPPIAWAPKSPPGRKLAGGVSNNDNLAMMPSRQLIMWP